MGQIDQSPKYGDGFYMPRDGATTFGDIQGKLPVLRVNCGKCPVRVGTLFNASSGRMA
jgi:hypothetical protein